MHSGLAQLVVFLSPVVSIETRLLLPTVLVPRHAGAELVAVAMHMCC
jgi:hypothetical protein